MWFNRKVAYLTEVSTGHLGVERLLKQADEKRDEGDAPTAAELYRVALEMAPDRNDVKVQLGNMLKDTGRLREAQALYLDAQAADPNNADICIQLGHTLKLMGNRSGAIAQYRLAAALNPDSPAAVEELAEAGASWQQQRRFEVHLRAGGVEAVMSMTRQIAEMRASLDRIAAMLPDALAQTAFPVDLYGSYREVFETPPPPPGATVPLTIVLLADREPLDTFYAQLAALRGQSFADWRLIVLGHEPERETIVRLAAGGDPRIGWEATDPATEPALAEWRAARAVAAGWLVLPGRGAILHAHALAWFAAAPRLGAAAAYVADQDQSTVAEGRTIHATPVFRQVVDYDTLLEANVFGETIAIAAATYAEILAEAPAGSPTRSRSRLLLDLASAGRVGHIPAPLVSTRDAVPPSLPEHRLAVEAHLAARGLAGRVQVAKGESGPTFWRPLRADAPIAVIIPTLDNADDLRNFVRSLRERASVPDALRIVIVRTGEASAGVAAVLDELAAKRSVTMLSGALPFNWSRVNNEAARQVDAPYLVFANDDMLMIAEGWDVRLRGLLERDEIGAVGARLLYGDETVQHAGMLFGWKNKVIHDGLYEPADLAGPAQRWRVTRATSAVTGAFLATRRERFLALGGFDQDGLPVGFSDVDYALKLREAGLKVLWTPAITLLHYESKTRGLDHLVPEKLARNQAEQAVVEARWGDVLDHDPSVNPIWVSATLPFRLLAAPSEKRVLDHIARTAAPNPWAVRRRNLANGA